MANGIKAYEAADDLWMSRNKGGQYEYWKDVNNNLSATFFDSAGRIVGTQSVTITVGEFKPVDA